MFFHLPNRSSLQAYLETNWQLRKSVQFYFLNYFGQNKGYHGLLQLFSVKFIFLDKAMNSGKKYENS